MPIKQFEVGGDRNFAYLVWEEPSMEALVIDPSYSPDMILEYAGKLGCKIIYLINTHRHLDHTNGNARIEEITGVKATAFGDKVEKYSLTMVDGLRLPLGSSDFKIIHTPGHTEDSICIYYEGQVFTGDTLFIGKVGGTGSAEEARTEYFSLHKKLLKLPERTLVYPGHNYGTTTFTTLGEQKRGNPFLLQNRFEDFYNLKLNWEEYKKEHGIK